MRDISDNPLSLEIFLILLSLLPLLLFSGEFDTTNIVATAAETGTTDDSNTQAGCISYDSAEKIITIKCGSNNHLTDIYNTLKNRNVIERQSDGIWSLNAGITVEKGATLVIDPQDTKWLKIIADGTAAYPIDILGGLKIDSVKVTSWNPSTNNYATTNGTRDLSDNKVVKGDPRPYIRVEEEATGTSDITNSEIAYLGYESGEGGGKTGLRYDGGSGSILRDNNIHHLYFGFYSSEVGGMVIENNQIHHNGHYGFDPHTGTHDMIIRNNTVYDNGGIGIICSLDCHNITIEKNKIYNNAKRGIMFSRNMSDSIARNNLIDKEENAITVSESHNNEIYNNRISNSEGGIDIDKESTNNVIHNNTVILAKNPNSQQPSSSSSDAIAVEKGAEMNNKIYSNTIQ
jgi:poly(beta-D-mannuronate) C5 epimerase